MNQSLDERIKECLNSLPLACTLHRKSIEREISLALKIQDKITRHACAENVMKLTEAGERIPASYAHQAIMNTMEGVI